MTEAIPKKHNLLDEVNGVADEINNILNKKQKSRYFEGIAVLHSFIEDIVKWLVFVQIVWNKTRKEKPIPTAELKKLKKYCNQLSFNSLLNVGLSIDLLEFPLFQRLDAMRSERNQIVHQYWLYTYKGKRNILKKKLEKLAGLANSLVGKLNQLVEETGMDESYGLFVIRTGKNLIP